jgi:cyclic beta-1,2-glucan synthetase
MHRAAIGSIFGLKQEAQTLVFHPCLPSHWPLAELTLVRGTRRMRFILMRATPDAARQATQALAATLLLPGQVLHWTELPDQSCFVIPL